MNSIISLDRSIIPACDVSTLAEFRDLVRQTADIDAIGGYKIGFELGLGYGLPKIAEVARKCTNKPLIYDHQKAGTDIPDTGKSFARICKSSGIDAIILFPQAGPKTEEAWIKAAQDENLGVIVGGLMTHSSYVRSEGGYLADEAIMEMYLNAAALGVTEFVVPGNKPDKISKIKTALEERGIAPIFYSPGFLAQGGSITAAAEVAGQQWHAIVGRGIYQASDMGEAARTYASQLRT